MKSCTASKAALLAACPFAFSGRVQWSESRGDAAVRGDEFHRAVAAMVDDTIPREPIKGTAWLAKRLKRAQAWIDANYVRGWRAEEAYAYDPETGSATLLGHNIGRAYAEHGRKDHELAGSADIVWRDELGSVHVADWKTGRFVTESVWHQMHWLGLFAARHYGATHATLHVLHVTDSGVVSALGMMNRAGLNAVEDSLRAQLRAIPDAWPVDGPHCDALFCPAREGCDLYQIRKGKTAA